MFGVFKHFSDLGMIFDPEINYAPAGGGGAPANGYVLEDGVTNYVAEDNATFYVQEV